ncbi:UPF0280 family protein [Roseibium aggregatum]|uniref:UPF0280 family protein n=1 Tax=Roseibium aggregatum TaxID=187304 RepID=A0A939EIA3_9HYPH|nr:UPF0280 family protein [Roseibium aggregatum]MBN9672235.1 UPF0280 family protein [Roseibium aggregatum]
MNARVWSEGARAQRLPDGRRLHLQHGPIDLIVEAFGERTEVERAYDQACAVFPEILPELAGELTRLRAPEGPQPQGRIARRMCDAVQPFAPEFVTPMAAVAGSVADAVLSALCAGRSLTRAYVNNGGDIALHLAEGRFRIGICTDPVTGKAGGVIDLSPDDSIGGIATSGWRGRSHSLGIADAVTALAATAAQADAAATVIANKVDLPGSPKIARTPASELAPDSDLGRRLVTTDVRPLSSKDIQNALGAGERAARLYRSRGLIKGAGISLSGDYRTLAYKQETITDPREAACA